METTEEKIEEKQEPKKITKTVKWFNEYCVENKSDIKTICDITSRSIQNQFNMFVKSSNTEVYALIFFVTFSSILDFLSKKQNQYDNFSFEICNSMNIGYTNNTDDNNEKVGNFMPIIEYISINRTIIRDEDYTGDDAIQRSCIQWKQQNLKQNQNFCDEIQNKAATTLKNEYGIHLITNDIVIPIFCIFIDTVVQVLKLKFQEALSQDVSEVSMNILGLFTAYYSFNEEENKEVIEYVPGIYTKLRSKSDLKSFKEE